MKKFKTLAHIHSLDGELREVIVVGKETLFGHIIPNAYIVDYLGKRYTALFNVYNNKYYVDDIYGLVEE